MNFNRANIDHSDHDSADRVTTILVDKEKICRSKFAFGIEAWKIAYIKMNQA